MIPIFRHRLPRRFVGTHQTSAKTTSMGVAMQPACPKTVVASVLGVLLMTAGSAALGAQHAARPTAYSIVEKNSMMHPETVTIARDGNLVMNDLVVPRSGAMPQPMHIRSILDLRTHRQLSWDPTDHTEPCTTGTLGGGPGDWSGNPFEWLSQMVGDDLSPYHPRKLGTTTVAGMPATVTELTGPDGSKMKIWVNEKYGLLLKTASADKGKGKPYHTDFEVIRFTVGKPPASTFRAPAGCPKL